MRLFVLFFVAASIWITPLYADNSNCLLWEVQGENNRIFLLGSIHMMRAEDYPLDSCVDSAYQQVDKLVVELNTQAIDQNEMASKMALLGLLPAGEQLEQHLSPQTAKLLSQLKMLPMGYQQMRPWYLALILTLQGAAELDYRADLGVDYYLVNKAAGVKPILALETLDQQLAVLSGDTMEQQDFALRLTLQQLPEMDDYISAMNSSWRDGNAEEIYHMMEEPKQVYPQLEGQFKRLVTERNQQMAKKIHAMLGDKEDYLVVVGGGHLGGDLGILKLLERQGVELTQLPKIGRSMLY